MTDPMTGNLKWQQVFDSVFSTAATRERFAQELAAPTGAIEGFKRELNTVGAPYTVHDNNLLTMLKTAADTRRIKDWLVQQLKDTASVNELRVEFHYSDPVGQPADPPDTITFTTMGNAGGPKILTFTLKDGAIVTIIS